MEEKMGDKLIKVLLIEDNIGDAQLISETLVEVKDIPFEVVHADRLSTGLERLAETDFDVVLLDLTLPDAKGLEPFSRIHAQAPQVPIILLTGVVDDKTATQAVREGAQDYLVKWQVGGILLVRSIRYAIERQRAEEVLKKYAEQLEDANRLKDLFTDIMSHDLLNPAGTIANALELMEDWELDEEQEKLREILEESAKRIIEMIKNASTYEKLESAEKLEVERLDLNEVFGTVLESFMPRLEKKKMKLKYLPKGKSYVVVNPMIENVFSNLLSNAIKYSPEGKKIEVDIIDEDDHFKIYFKDWGSGISDEDKARLFTRFQRVDKKGVKGSGLGLAIVKRAVELHKGKVWIEDNSEGGSIFYIEIPKNLS